MAFLVVKDYLLITTPIDVFATAIVESCAVEALFSPIGLQKTDFLTVSGRASLPTRLTIAIEFFVD